MKFKTLTLISLFLFTFISGLIIGKLFFGPVNQNAFSETRSNSSEHQLTNPLLECDGSNFGYDRNLDNLKNKIDNYIKTSVINQQISFAAVYYRDLNNGPWIGINQSELFSPASLIKVPTMITYFKKAEKDPSFLQQTLIDNLSASNIIPQNIPPSTTLTPQQAYSVEELIERMIAYSDNQAYELLNQNISGNELLKTYTDLGVDISRGLTNPTGNIISVKAYASFFRILFNASYLSQEYSEKALKILTKTTFKDGITKYLPSSTIVAHKFGERKYLETEEKQLHDCGIVYLPKKPYLVCIMTRGKEFDKMANTIAEISKQIYQEINKN